MDMDVIFHIHGNPADGTQPFVSELLIILVTNGAKR